MADPNNEQVNLHMDDREKSPGAPDAQIPPPKAQPKFEHLPKRFLSQR